MTLDGFKQGSALSNLLFNIGLESSIRKFCVQRNESIFNKSYMLLGFADDIDIIGVDSRGLHNKLKPRSLQTRTELAL